MSNEADIFAHYRPEITEQKAIEAGQDGRIIRSFNAHPISNADGTIPSSTAKRCARNFIFDRRQCYRPR
jgi:hypothetical protein